MNNRELTHRGVGVGGEGYAQNAQKFGKFAFNNKDEDFQFPSDMLLRNQIESSPYAFRSEGRVTMPTAYAALTLLYPCVLFDDNEFGQGTYDAKQHSRDNKPWRMYVQNNADKTIHMLESVDGITWTGGQQLATATFPASPNHMEEGLQVFYDADGIVTVSGDSYPFAAIAKDDAKTTGDATDLWLFYSEDGIDWSRVAMGNHDVSGDPFVEVSSSFGRGASYLAATEEGAGTFNATRPRTFRNADGDWFAIVRANNEPANAGDTANTEQLLAMNSTDAADYNEIGHFANWNRKLLASSGEGSYNQAGFAIIHYVVKFKDYYIGLVQLWHQVAGGPTRVRSGLAVAISRDCLVFDYVGPLYDAGLVYAFNHRTGAIDDTNMDSTAYDRNQGNGDGSQIQAGSIVVDKTGRCFSTKAGVRSTGRSEFARVYWTELSSGKVLYGYF